MNKSELSSKVSAQAGLSKTVTETVLEALGEVVSDALASRDEVSLPGIGKFDTKERAARTGRNPQTGAALNIPAKSLSDAVNS